VTYPDPHGPAHGAVGDTERRVTLLVIAASALAVCATAVAGLLTALAPL
jgi:hypothetical protein